MINSSSALLHMDFGATSCPSPRESELGYSSCQSFAVQHNFQSGFFVTDCMQVVSAFNGRVAEVHVNLLPLLDRLKSVCRAHHFQVYWFPRHALLRCNQ